ncbi:NDR1/HIN1-like protein 1 [Aristolochia californica]|uniref:NDR1/HIN1-like protein 1 n=1 Tax=Aristolochia californica TaxID=171875 RepID=UPI0035DC7D97
MSKHCGSHDHKRRKLYRRLFAAFLAFIILVLLIVFIIWLVLRPTKPRFSLQDAAVYQFNLSGPNLLTTTVQISLVSRNPNDRIGVYYDRLVVYASYRNQQVTLGTVLPSTYQGDNDVIVWSPFLNGASVPVSPYLGLAIGQDQTVGYYILNIKVDGRVRWKVGTWISGGYHLYVNCPAYFRLDSHSDSGNGVIVKLQVPVGCSVDV